MSLPPVPFWFLRHGQTDYNAAGLSQGALDISLNETGRSQAAAAAPLLVGHGIVEIVTSPMRRTMETTEIVNAVLGLPVHVEPDLREVVFGGMEGKPLLPWFPEWMEGRMTPEGAESFADLRDRAAGAMSRVLARPGPVLVVAHGGIFRALRDLMGLPKEGLTQNAVPLVCRPVGTGWGVAAA
jgi:probable phosphoglycerate mutase